jgi:DNA-binding transcriptional LysR family regulator
MTSHRLAHHTGFEGYLVSIHDLEIFRRLVVTGSMSEAGRQLGVSPAMVSKRIGVLEEQQGTPLFYRSVQRLELTPGGSIFHKHRMTILSWIKPAPASLPACIAGNDNSTAITSATCKPSGHGASIGQLLRRLYQATIYQFLRMTAKPEVCPGPKRPIGTPDR